MPVRLVERGGEVWAEPVLGKSNLIYTLVSADGIVPGAAGPERRASRARR